jgi:hypothetical protein
MNLHMTLINYNIANEKPYVNFILCCYRFISRTKSYVVDWLMVGIQTAKKVMNWHIFGVEMLSIIVWNTFILAYTRKQWQFKYTRCHFRKNNQLITTSGVSKRCHSIIAYRFHSDKYVTQLVGRNSDRYCSIVLKSWNSWPGNAMIYRGRLYWRRSFVMEGRVTKQKSEYTGTSLISLTSPSSSSSSILRIKPLGLSYFRFKQRNVRLCIGVSISND